MRHAALELAIGGMSSAGCAASPEAALGRVAGVAQVIVNLGTERASIAYDADLTSVPSLIQAVEGAGFQERTETVTLPIRGMTCAACVNSVACARPTACSRPPPI
jgi:Cu+-exporting ATPase